MHPVEKLGPTLLLLMALREQGDPPPPYVEIVNADTVGVYLTLALILEEPGVAELEELGVVFHREGEEVIHVGTVYSADALWEALYPLAERAEVLSIESAWRPGVVPPN